MNMSIYLCWSLFVRDWFDEDLIERMILRFFVVGCLNSRNDA